MRQRPQRRGTRHLGGGRRGRCAGKNALTAEGSTSQQNAIALFNQAWAQACGTKNVSYNPTGSGAGRDQFIANHVDFAGSDSTLTPEQVPAAAKRCGGNPAWHLPLVFGPIGLAYHLDGVDTLVLNGDVLAKIFSGAVTAWNDPAIGALNPGAALPATKITPIYRSDSSGTTDNFQQYLAATAPQSWTKGAGSEFAGGVGEGADKSAGVVQAVQTTPGASATSSRASPTRPTCGSPSSTPAPGRCRSPTARRGPRSKPPRSRPRAATICGWT
ncbi:Phosphate-binding protein PstS3 [Mycobacterium talmoniae]|uniref:Phosphate-binding protein PstS3 n=1 Tax=Mycobacterium talmoniae TaxID=1858794 RepID=A0A2S8BRD6_9MYCO|nr:Phosphate-binding protein PstS3 [Mycobacterium talmoniae]